MLVAGSLGLGWGQMQGTSCTQGTEGQRVSVVSAPISVLWAGQLQGLPCQKWGPQGERELWGPREGTPRSVGCGVSRLPVGLRVPGCLSLPLTPPSLPQGLTGPIGPPGPAGANGEKVSRGSLSSLCLTSPIESLSHLLPKTAVSSPRSIPVGLLLCSGCKEWRVGARS